MAFNKTSSELIIWRMYLIRPIKLKVNLKMKTMINIFFSLLYSNVGTRLNNFVLFFFRIAVSLELIFAHGLKKIGVGTELAEM